jgi:hypothetical protein
VCIYVRTFQAILYCTRVPVHGAFIFIMVVHLCEVHCAVSLVCYPVLRIRILGVIFSIFALSISYNQPVMCGTLSGGVTAVIGGYGSVSVLVRVIGGYGFDMELLLTLIFFLLCAEGGLLKVAALGF